MIITNRKQALTKLLELHDQMRILEQNLRLAKDEAINLERIVLGEIISPTPHYKNGAALKKPHRGHGKVQAVVGKAIRDYGSPISTHDLKQLLADLSPNSIETSTRALAKLGMLNTYKRDGQRYWEIAVHKS